jgi:hypothetical protein
MGAVRPGIYDDNDLGATVTNTDAADVTTTGGPRAEEDLPPSVRNKQEGTR